MKASACELQTLSKHTFCLIPGEWVGEGGRMIITRAAVSEQSEAKVSHPRETHRFPCFFHFLPTSKKIKYNKIN